MTETDAAVLFGPGLDDVDAVSCEAVAIAGGDGSADDARSGYDQGIRCVDRLAR